MGFEADTGGHISDISDEQVRPYNWAMQIFLAIDCYAAPNSSLILFMNVGHMATNSTMQEELATVADGEDTVAKKPIEKTYDLIVADNKCQRYSHYKVMTRRRQLQQS